MDVRADDAGDGCRTRTGCCVRAVTGGMPTLDSSPDFHRDKLGWNDSDDIKAGIPWPGLTHRMTAIALRGGFKAYFNRVNRATCDAVERSYSLAHPRELPRTRLTYPVADGGLRPL